MICPSLTESPRRAAAFTLLEVLAALMLLAIVLPVVMRGLSMATQVGSYTRYRDQAVGLAEAKLAEIVASEDWQTGDASGTFDDEDLWGKGASRYNWQQQVDDWQIDAIKQVTIDVTWQQRNEEQIVTLATLVHTEGL